jgi:hypothetical protein
MSNSVDGTDCRRAVLRVGERQKYAPRSGNPKIMQWWTNIFWGWWIAVFRHLHRAHLEWRTIREVFNYSMTALLIYGIVS